MTIRVILADDQALMRAGFRMLIQTATDIEVVGEAADGREVVQLAHDTHADVVLMDIRMPEMDGLAATQAITADKQLADVRILILTTFEADEYVLHALRNGASGFLGKTAEPAALIDAIRLVAAGEALLSPKATKALIHRYLTPHDPATGIAPELAALTEREREVLTLVADGLSNDAIAEHLHVSPLTAKTHVNRIMAKVGARDRAQLVVLAYQTGFARSHR
jgi:DNA-binding NarL/FixJ family response regulator